MNVAIQWQGNKKVIGLIIKVLTAALIGYEPSSDIPSFTSVYRTDFHTELFTRGKVHNKSTSG